MITATAEQVEGKRYAYAFYATNDRYAVSALVAISRLKRLGVGEAIDFVVLHLSVSRYLLARMNEMGVITKRVERLPPAYGRYFRDCLVKLRILQLTEYDRVVFLDADAIPMSSLDELFTKTFDEEIAAPRAYWLEQPWVTSLLLVVKPSVDLWERVRRRFDSAYEDRLFDGEIINFEFEGAIHFLSDEYACLNSEWEDRDSPFHFGTPDESFKRIKVVHFSALGKPWSFHPNRERRLRPNAHPKFWDVWQQWWTARDEIFEHSPLHTRLRAALLKHRSIDRLYAIRPYVRRVCAWIFRGVNRSSQQPSPASFRDTLTNEVAQQQSDKGPRNMED